MAESSSLFERLVGLKRHADFGWFIMRPHEETPGFELGLLNKQNDVAPVYMSYGQSSMMLRDQDETLIALIVPLAS